jgi:hypothetical protein
MGGDLVAELATDCKIQEKRGLAHIPHLCDRARSTRDC